MKTSNLRWSILFVLALAGCSPLASYRIQEARLPAAAPDERAVIEDARHVGGDAALADYLSVARNAAARLERGDRSQEALETYNYSVARVVEALDKSELDPWQRPVVANSSSGTWQIRGVPFKRKGVNPSDFRIIPCDTVVTGGTYFQNRVTTAGIGAPVVVVQKKEAKDFHKTFAAQHVYGCATMLLHFRGNTASLEGIESMTYDRAELGGRSFPLAADYTAPMAMAMAIGRPDKLGLIRLLRPGNYANTARMTRLQLYDPQRIPVLFVHGLQDTPATWAPMVQGLLADPVIRKKYQFWVYSYPSGYPYPYSASLLRHELDAVNAAFPDHKKIIIVGHSMGGIISRLMVTDSGEHVWRDFFGKSPAETKLSKRNMKLAEDVLIFRHRAEISRAVFISAPHRGSNLATDWIGRIGSRLVHLPAFIADARDALVSTVTDPSGLAVTHMPNSIDTLAPNNRFVKSVSKLPIAPGIPYHSIMGDRGKGDTPNSSDGVVPYWSSHLDGAVSEKIVPSHHSAHQNPEGIAEVKRILRKYL
ncbi:MAG: alpha/beta hydrolase [Luteolibacter sp.]